MTLSTGTLGSGTLGEPEGVGAGGGPPAEAGGLYVATDLYPAADLYPATPPPGPARPARLRWALCDRLGAVLSDLPRRKVGGREVEINLNGQRTARVGLHLDEVDAALALPFARSLKVWLDEALIFFGPITLTRFSGYGGDIGGVGGSVAGRSVEIFATDPSVRLIQAFTHGFAFQQQIEQSEIMWRLVAHANDRAVAAGVPGPGVVRGTTPAVILRDRFYPDGKQIWQALGEMTEVLDGPDLELEPLDRADGVYAQLNTYWPWQGTDRTATVIFEHNVGRHNAGDFAWEPGGGEIVNYAVFGGQGVEGQASPAWVAFQPESMTEHGIYEHFQAMADVTRTQTLREHAEGLVAARAYPVDFFDVTPTVEEGGIAVAYRRDQYDQLTRLGEGFGVPPRFGPPGFGDYWIGDEIRAIGRHKPGLDVELVGRVVTAKLNELDSGSIAVELACAPRIDAAGIEGFAATVSTENLAG